jgi:steroid delta-isomerase-like uncharacterized protein
MVLGPAGAAADNAGGSATESLPPDVPPPIAALIAEVFAGWNAHDLDRVLACYAPDFVGIDSGEATHRQGTAQVRKMVRRWFRAFPDLRLVCDSLIVQGDRVACEWAITGTHRGPFMRIPATHRPISLRGVSLLTIVDGRIAATSRIWDLAAFLRDVGLLPELSADTGEE